MKKVLFILIMMIVLISSCSRKIEDPCIYKDAVDSISLSTDKIVCFNTVDSYDINHKDKGIIKINARLYLPDEKRENYAAVILTHGSGGIRKYHQKYVQLLTEIGYIVFQIDHYSARRIKYDKTFSKVSGVTFLNDAYAALDVLKKHPKITKVGYLGWSQGGVGPILTHFEFVNQLYSTDNRFDASIAIYPYCGFTFNSSYNTETPLLMITGADDDLTPEAACRNIYSKFFRNDGKINLISIDNARHGFDNPFLILGITFDNLPNLKIINNDCTLTISKIGEIVNLSGVVINTPELSQYFLDKCSFKGVTVKYNHNARIIALDKVEDFFNSHLNMK